MGRATTVPLIAAPSTRVVREVLSFEQRANLELRLLSRHRVRATLDPLKRFLHGFHLPDPVTRDDLLGLCERAIDDQSLGPGETHSLTVAAGVQPVPSQH